MEDWSDIFAEVLKDVEETQPADDWMVFQQKYSAAKRRRKAAQWSCAVLASAVVAAVALFVLLFNGEPDISSDLPLMADKETGILAVPDIDEPETEAIAEGALVEPTDVYNDFPLRKLEPSPKQQTAPSEINDDQVEALLDEAAEDEIAVVKDTVETPTELLLADKGAINEPSDEWLRGEWIGQEASENPKVKRRKVYVGLSGSSVLIGDGIIPKMLGDELGIEGEDTFADVPGSDDGHIGVNPPLQDTSAFNGPASRSNVILPSLRKTLHRARKVVSKDMDHYMPVSYGVSARFALTKKFSLNTGLNYTLYTSKRTVLYSDGTVEEDRQMAHYLGIPLRCDWMLVDRPRFGMYIGIGAQVDRFLYAKVGNERLYDRSFLWSVNSALGLQYNISPRLSLYAEPELTGNIGHSQLETYRDDAEVMITARLGFRINL